jgi:lipopolysaccharide biosynthesis glycosyltransferase
MAVSAVEEGTPKDEVAVAFAADENVALGLYVSIYSLLANASGEAKYVVYVFDGGLMARTKEKLHQLGARFSRAEIRIISASTDRIDELRDPQHVGRAAYLRLLVPEKTKSQHRKVIYLDSDVLVLQDIGELYFSNTEENIVMASQDYLYPTVRAVSEITEMPGVVSQPEGNPYFNSGVLLIDTEKWTSNKITHKTIEYLKKYPNHSPFADQDALNSTLSDSWGVLTPDWNVQVARAKKKDDQRKIEKENAKIIHYNVSNKPWEIGYNVMHGDVYVNYMTSSGWFSGSGKYGYVVARYVGDVLHKYYRRLAETSRPVRHKLGLR